MLSLLSRLTKRARRETLHLRATGHVLAIMRDENGREVDRRENHNLVMNAGLDSLIDRVFKAATVEPVFSRMAIGSNATAPAATDTTLVAETARVAYTYARVGVGSITLSATFGAGVGTGTVAEGGCFNDAAAGDMWNRFLLGPMTKGAGNTLDVVVTITFTAA